MAKVINAVPLLLIFSRARRPKADLDLNFGPKEGGRAGTAW